MPVLRVVAGDEVVQVFALQRIRLQREVLIGSKVVNPQRFCPRSLASRLAVEEQDVCFDSLGVEDPCRQAEQSVDIALLQQFPTDGLSRTAFEQYVVACTPFEESLSSSGAKPKFLLRDKRSSDTQALAKIVEAIGSECNLLRCGQKESLGLVQDALLHCCSPSRGWGWNIPHALYRIAHGPKQGFPSVVEKLP